MEFSKENKGFDGFTDDKLCRDMQDIIVFLSKENYSGWIIGYYFGKRYWIMMDTLYNC